MAISDTAFAALANAALHRLEGAIEAMDEEDALEVDGTEGVLTIELPSGRQFVVNRNIPARQMWLSSPLSGGLHFNYDEEKQAWMLADGRQLDTLLKSEVLEMLLSEE